MHLNYTNNCSKLPGIYKIINTHTNRIYIGQCKSFQERWHGHSCSLRKQKHQNKFLQNDYNKCVKELGHDNFIEFHVLEIMENSSKEERNKKEEEYISQFFDKQNSCYNFKEKTESADRSCRSFTPEETKEKVSASMKKAWSEKTPEQRQEIANKIGAAHKGKKLSFEHIEKSRLANLGRIPWNKGIEWSEMKGENHPLFGTTMSEETKQKIRDSVVDRIPWNKGITGYTMPPCSEEKKKKIGDAHRGRKLTLEHIEKVKATRKTIKINYKVRVYDDIKLQSPNGTVYTRVENLTEFSKTHDLNFKLLWKLLNNKTPSHYGWRLIP